MDSCQTAQTIRIGKIKTFPSNGRNEEVSWSMRMMYGSDLVLHTSRSPNVRVLAQSFSGTEEEQVTKASKQPNIT
ncbi:hypothetical protein ACLOJK_033447 [Asimina triloba]